MPQVSLYLDRDAMKRVAREASRSGKSLSGWVRDRVLREPATAWPAGYFDRIPGSLADSGLRRPAALASRHNTPREQL